MWILYGVAIAPPVRIRRFVIPSEAAALLPWTWFWSARPRREESLCKSSQESPSAYRSPPGRRIPRAARRTAELGALLVPVENRLANAIHGLLCHQRSEEHTSELQSHVNLVCRL